MPSTEKISDLDRAAIEAYGDFTVVDEDYGFSIRPGRRLRRRATLVEWTAQYMGFLSIFGTFGLVAGRSGLSGTRLDVFEVGIFMAGVVMATVFFWLGTRGTAIELQVDRRRHQFRSAVRNYRGKVRILDIYDFRLVESAFVHKLGQRAKTGSFSIRTHSDPNGIALLSGNAKAVGHLHVILARILRPAIKPLARKSRAIFNRNAALAAE